MTDKKQQLEELATDILTQNICADLAAQATQLVMGDGNLDADIVFIGEAPGKKEDEQGIPFVGAAGRFLNVMLEAAGMVRSEVYITNIVKYRPPNNRDPSPEEKAAFWPYLVRQLEIIQPKVVITLGLHSMSYFLPGAIIGDVHGQPKIIHFHGNQLVAEGDSLSAFQGSGEQQTEVRKRRSAGVAEPLTQNSAKTVMSNGGFADGGHNWSVVLLPLYHPAAALYNGSLRQTLIEDFVAVPGIIAGLSLAK